MIPSALLRVHARFEIAGSVRTAATRAHHPEACRVQIIEGLLDKVVLQEETVRVATRAAAIRIATFVERLPERLPTQTDLSADQQTSDLAELDVGKSVSSDGERAAVTEDDVARRPHWLRVVVVVVLGVVRGVVTKRGKVRRFVLRRHRAGNVARQLRQAEVFGLRF